MAEDPKELIERLIKSGMTEVAISDALRDMDVEVTQATINRLKNGVHKSTSFEIGYGLLKLAQSLRGDRAVRR
jgi:hypothetical protein